MKRSLRWVLLFLSIAISTRSFAQWASLNDGLYGGCMAANGADLFLSGPTSGGLYKSIDGGANWTAINNGFSPDLAVNKFFFAGDTLYASTPGSGVYKTYDNGTNWIQDTLGLYRTIQGDFIQTDVMFSYCQNIFVGTDESTSSELYYHYRSGGNWLAITGFVGKIIKQAVVVNSIIYAASDKDGIYKSTSAGAFWVKTNSAGLSGKSIYVNGIVSKGNDLYSATKNGVYKSVDGSDSWTRVDVGFPVNTNSESTVYALYSDNTKIFASALNNKVFYSSNDSVWTDISSGLTYSPHFFISKGADLYACSDGNELNACKYTGIVDPLYDPNATPASNCTGTCTVVPGSLMVSNLTSTSAMLSWGAIPEAGTYNIRHRSTSSGTWTTVSSVSASYSLGGLTASTAYEFQVEAVCFWGTSEFSDSKAFTTATSGIVDKENGIRLIVYHDTGDENIHIKCRSMNGTRIRFYLADISGRILFMDNLKCNEQTLIINASGLGSGVYFYKATTDGGNTIGAGKLMVVK